MRDQIRLHEMPVAARISVGEEKRLGRLDSPAAVGIGSAWARSNQESGGSLKKGNSGRRWNHGEGACL